MRGTLAKRLRKIAEGNVKDYKLLKKAFKEGNAGEPKLEERSKRDRLHGAKIPPGWACYPQRRKPLAVIGAVFIDFNQLGIKRALKLARCAGQLAKPDLEREIDKLIRTEENYRGYKEQQPERSTGDEQAAS